MPEPLDLDLSPLNSLSDEHKTTVAAALKTTLARELAKVSPASGVGMASAAEHTRESGPLHGSQHSREKGSAALDSVISQLHTMDEHQFQRFSTRLAQLKQIQGGGS